MFNSIDIYYTHLPLNHDMLGADPDIELLYFEPEPLLKILSDERKSSSTFIQCPAFQDFYKNTFLVRAPVDLTIITKTLPSGQKSFYTKEYDQKFFDDAIVLRPDQSITYPILSVRFNYVFYTNEPVIVEQIHPTMHKTDLLNNINVICGKFDISKWVRPVELAFEIIDDTKPLVIKRGDPIFYIRFESDKKINLIKSIDNAAVKHAISSCTGVKNYMPMNTMKKNYKIAESYMKAFKKKMFKNKCPFGFK